MSVNYRELLKDYIRYVEECKGTTCLEHGNSHQWSTDGWESLKEILNELGLWYVGQKKGVVKR